MTQRAAIFSEYRVDETARGIAMAALTLHFVTLEQFVRKGALTPPEAIEIANRSLEAMIGGLDDERVVEVSEVAQISLINLREELAELLWESERGEATS